MNSLDINQIAYKAINSRFSYGNYLGVRVVIDTTIGYLQVASILENALTKGGKSKLFGDWKRTEVYSELIDEFDSISRMGIPILENSGILEPVVIIQDVNISFRGAYIHPDLAPHLASWASPKLGLKISRIINDWVIKDAVVSRDL